jgi:hypothetical protein
VTSRAGLDAQGSHASGLEPAGELSATARTVREDHARTSRTLRGEASNRHLAEKECNPDRVRVVMCQMPVGSARRAASSSERALAAVAVLLIVTATARAERAATSLSSSAPSTRRGLFARISRPAIADDVPVIERRASWFDLPAERVVTSAMKKWRRRTRLLVYPANLAGGHGLKLRLRF